MTAVWLGQSVGSLAVGLGFIPTACTEFCNNFSLEENLAQPRYIGEGLGPFSKQCARLC